MTLDLPLEEGGPMEIEMEMDQYVVAEVVYMRMTMPELPTTWVKQDLPPGYWEEMSEIEQGIELLEFAQAELLGMEQVGGTNCYLLKVEPEIEKLWEAMMQQPGMGELMGGEIVDLEEIVESFLMRMWIAKNTFFPMKDEMRMTMFMSSEAMDLPPEEEEFEMTMEMETTSIYRNHNQPVSIELPAEAAGAVEMPFL